ncbi:MAG: DUF58 domain-containing protein [Candidatus Eisenbacteria bacterium]|uniref:DUF58 domain-containing protein n=1 Tax=Eiseniibacteriota bacterium TaxID=2212470 RepID=A0A956RPK0_UNCEI|nr:DUF58 domain-containing protein [Candidatus Eisenbacteria bacterium]
MVKPSRSKKTRDDLFWESEEARLSEVEDEEEAAMRILRGVRKVEISSRRLVQEIFGGEYHSAFRGQGIEFSEVREYVAGDDVRLIDRNVSARMQHPYIKIFHEERELSVIFLVDQSGSTRFGSTGKTRAEVAAELVAILAFSAISNNDKVGCCLFSDEVEKWVPPGKGRRHVLHVVREVLFGRPHGRGTNIAAGLEMVARIQKRRSVLFVVSDFFDRGFEAALSVAARRHEVIPLVLVDPAERVLPNVGLVEIEDLETGERRLIDSSDPKVRRAYAQGFERFEKDEIPKAFRRANVTPVWIPLDGDVLAPLHKYFRARVRRRMEGR